MSRESRRQSWLAALVLAAACTGAGPSPAPAASTSATSGPSKPHAPVELTLRAEPGGSGRYAVTLDAEALADLAALDLWLLLPEGGRAVGEPRLRAGATPAGARRTLVAEIQVEGAATIVGAARARIASGDQARTVSLRVGDAPAKQAEPGRVVITPLGPVAETGP